MTKEAYFEACEAIGAEPDPEDIPVEFEDLPADVQNILVVYNKLRDDFDGMNGIYLGKHMVGLIEILDIYEVPKEERRLVLEVISIIDRHRAVLIKAQMDSKKPTTKPSM